LNRLPVETQKALQQLACLGNSAEFAMLQVVYQDSNNEMHAQLLEAVRTGLIFRSEDSYRFLHDRVQEAAYSLIPQELRAEAHLRIGKLLAAHTPSDKLEEVIFEIVNQLNRGSHLIASGEDRKRVAELNFIAGRRAKASTAYASALKYLTAGRALLTQETWEDNYELIFNIEFYMAECELLTANKVAAENRLSMLAQRARSARHTAIVARLRLTLYHTMDRNDRAVEVCLEYLRRGGTDWSPHPTSDEARREYDRIWSQLGNRQIEELVDLPLITTPELLDVLDVLGEVVTPALCFDQNLHSLAICRMVNLSLEHGNSDGSCFAYVWFAMIAGPFFGNYRDGYRFGRLGYELVEKRGLTRYQARTYMSFGSYVLPWAKHALGGRDLVRRAFDAAYRIGDLTFAAYCCTELVRNFLIVGDPLAEVQPEAENALAFVQRARFGLTVDIIIVQVGLIRTFRGLTPKFGCFNDEGFDELEFERHLASNQALMLADFWYCEKKVQARFFAGDYATAVDASLRAEQLLWTSPSQFKTEIPRRLARFPDVPLAEFRFYAALSYAAAWDSAPSDQRQHHFEALTAHHRQLEIWAEHCPENFENRAALVGAEIARIEGRVIDAEGLYEKAIRSAHANGFIHNEAVAYEVAARFYAARGFEKIAYAYLREAQYGYRRWGADGKVKQLEQSYPDLRKEGSAAGPTSTIAAPVELLDLATVIKVSQAVSGEMVLEKLIDKLMRAAIEHAGAKRGLLILPRGVEERIEAEATTSRDDIIVHLQNASVTAAVLPESVVRYVMRTHEGVILDDASSPTQFSADPYIVQHRARSVLCLPLIDQARLTGVLYLENNLAPHVFSPNQIAVLKVIASQAAISLENTRLYRDLENREAKIRRLVDANVMGIFFWNLEGAIVGANEAFLHMVQYSREDLVTGRMRWTDLTPAEWREREKRARTELQAAATVQPYEKEFLRKDGSRVPVLAGAALFEEGGNEGVAFVLDLSEQKRTEEAVRQSEKQLRDVIETMPAMAFTVLPDGSTEFANRRFTEYTGLKAEEVGLHRRNTVHPEDIEGHINKWEASLASGEPFENEVRYRGTNGQYRWFLVRGVPLRAEDGNILKWFANITDIEDRKQAEERLRNENVVLREEIVNRSMFEEIVGTSTVLQGVLARVAKVAPTDSTVLITGETGTGKELIARAIHKKSQRSGRSFVGVNCAAIPRELIASELFGHEKGAFTGAVQRRLGRFELAEGGTIFLDEIGELPAETQIALLRVLQEREFERVGGTKVIRADVRVIAATNRDLPASIDAGTFRNDLYYRLNVFPIEVPPLRKRKEDIPPLVAYFIDRYSSKVGKKVRGADSATLDRLLAYTWPGNVRELQNVIERSIILCETDKFTVDGSWLSRRLDETDQDSRAHFRIPASEEKKMIEEALADARGRVYGPSGAAAKLGVPPSTLDSKIKALKINKHRFKTA